MVDTDGSQYALAEALLQEQECYDGPIEGKKK